MILLGLKITENNLEVITHKMTSDIGTIEGSIKEVIILGDSKEIAVECKGSSKELIDKKVNLEMNSIEALKESNPKWPDYMIKTYHENYGVPYIFINGCVAYIKDIDIKNNRIKCDLSKEALQIDEINNLVYGSIVKIDLYENSFLNQAKDVAENYLAGLSEMSGIYKINNQENAHFSEDGNLHIDGAFYADGMDDYEWFFSVEKKYIAELYTALTGIESKEDISKPLIEFLKQNKIDVSQLEALCIENNIKHSFDVWR